MSSPRCYYKHSGKSGPLGLPLIFIVPILASAVLAFVYSTLLFYNPFIYINFLGTLFFGGLLGGIVMRMGITGKVRNVRITQIAGFVAAISAIYFSWVFYIFVLSGWEILVVSPINLLNVIIEVSEGGVWSLAGYTPTGIVLQILWGVEAIVIGFLCFSKSQDSIGEAVFCEATASWADDRNRVGPFKTILDVDGFKQKIEGGDYSDLLSLELSRGGDEFSAVEFIGVSTNPDFRLFSVINFVIMHEDDGKEVEKKHYVVKNVISSQEINDSIQGLLTTVEEPEAPAEEDHDAYTPPSIEEEEST